MDDNIVTPPTPDDNWINEYEESVHNSSDEEEDLEKIENLFDHKNLEKIHPEIININNKELMSLCKCVRNKISTIIDPLHQTVPFLTKYEKARVLGCRAGQLNNGAKPLIQITDNMIDGYTIACQELKQKKIPFIIRRPLPNGASEYWKLEDLEIIF
jgi:DNA-directed RNA polymerase I, II, and III subunit RPABC2